MRCDGSLHVFYGIHRRDLAVRDIRVLQEPMTEGFRMLREMVVPEHRVRVSRLIQQEELRMGLVPEDLDAAFEGAEASEAPTGGGGLLPAGDYEVTVLSAEVRDGRAPWVTAELSLKLQVDEGEHSGKVTFCDIELAPNTGKDGTVSKGKLGFVKGQLEGLGYSGKLSEVEYNTNSFLGARVAIRQKVDTHILEDGTFDQWARINPNTSKPYVDREVYLNDLLQAGFGAVPSAVSESASEPAVY